MSVSPEYRRLLQKLVPQPIHTDREYRRALRQLDSLMTPKPGAARSLMIEMLSTLIEHYESQKLPAPQIRPAELLSHLLEARGISQAELARSTDISPATLSSVLAEQRGISKQNAVTLASFFNVSPALFIAEAMPALNQPGE
jgi:HTH-type transcriptional regulator/antitoxin HigA